MKSLEGLINIVRIYWKNSKMNHSKCETDTLRNNLRFTKSIYWTWKKHSENNMRDVECTKMKELNRLCRKENFRKETNAKFRAIKRVCGFSRMKTSFKSSKIGWSRARRNLMSRKTLNNRQTTLTNRQLLLPNHTNSTTHLPKETPISSHPQRV